MRWLSGSVRRVAKTIAVCLALPVVAMADMVYVTCQNGDGLSLLDLEKRTEVARWSVPGKPAGVAVHANSVYTVAADAKKVRRHDPINGRVEAEATLDGGPIGIAHDALRERVFVSDWYNARIWVLEDQSLTVTHTLSTGAAPAGLAMSSDMRWLASADRDADQVSLFDATTLKLLARVNVGTRPFGLRFAPDGRLFVANVGSNDVSVIEPEAGKVIRTFPVGERPYGVAFAKGRAFVSNQYADSVSAVDLETFAPVALVPSGEYPEGIDTTSDGNQVIVANWFDNTVSIIDAGTLTVLDEISTCDGPRAFGHFVLGDFE